MVVVRPAVDSSGQEMEGGGERDVGSVVAIEIQQQEQSPREEEQEREGQSDHIGVDIEGAPGLVHPVAPVANA